MVRWGFVQFLLLASAAYGQGDFTAGPGGAIVIRADASLRVEGTLRAHHLVVEGAIELRGGLVSPHAEFGEHSTVRLLGDGTHRVEVPASLHEIEFDGIVAGPLSARHVRYLPTPEPCRCRSLASDPAEDPSTESAATMAAHAGSAVRIRFRLSHPTFPSLLSARTGRSRDPPRA